MRERGAIGPARAVDEAGARRAGRGRDPAEAGRSGTTNGAAMRIAPVGIAVPVGDALGRPGGRGVLVTHGTGVALAGAAAVAAAVSAGIDGATVRETFDVAADAAERAAERGRWVAAPTWPRGSGGPRSWSAASGSPWRRSPRSSAPAWPRRSRCPPRSPCSRSQATTRGSRAGSARRSAGTATPSPRWPGRWRARAAGWTRCRCARTSSTWTWTASPTRCWRCGPACRRIGAAAPARDRRR